MNYANIDRKRRLIIDESKATLAEWLYCYGDVLAGQPKLLVTRGSMRRSATMPCMPITANTNYRS